MTVFIMRRLLQSVVLVLVMSFLVFLGVFAIGDPINTLVPPDASQEERQVVIIQFGLDKPLYE